MAQHVVPAGRVERDDDVVVATVTRLEALWSGFGAHVRPQHLQYRGAAVAVGMKISFALLRHMIKVKKKSTIMVKILTSI